MITKELHTQIQNLDTKYWDRRVSFAFDKINTYKKLANKSPFIIDLYTSYLQLIEIFLLNTLSLLKLSWVIVFIKNHELRDLVKKTFYKDYSKKRFDRELISNLINNLVLGKKGTVRLKDRKGKLSSYSMFLQEVITDYLADYDLLNAFKHGYRVQGSGENSISITPTGSTKSFILSEFTASIVYLSKEKQTIYEMSVAFNYERIYLKSQYLINMLENMKEIESAIYGKRPITTLNHFIITDKAKIRSSFGVSRWKTPKYEIN
ncbi:hypothetical protein K8R14_03985 [bacterium]|nr:hypothetical protein [bacterium]